MLPPAGPTSPISYAERKTGFSVRRFELLIRSAEIPKIMNTEIKSRFLVNFTATLLQFVIEFG